MLVIERICEALGNGESCSRSHPKSAPTYSVLSYTILSYPIPIPSMSIPNPNLIPSYPSPNDDHYSGEATDEEDTQYQLCSMQISFPTGGQRIKKWGLLDQQEVPALHLHHISPGNVRRF
jgi:hypothetical protein